MGVGSFGRDAEAIAQQSCGDLGTDRRAVSRDMVGVRVGDKGAGLWGAWIHPEIELWQVEAFLIDDFDHRPVF